MRPPTEQPAPRVAKEPPYFRVEYTIADVAALQAVHRGNASPDQQTRVIEFIMRNLSHIREISFQPGDPTATAFAEGRRFVGHQIARLTGMSLRDLTLREQQQPPGA